MKKTIRTFLTICCASACFCAVQNMYAAPFFSGYAGIKDDVTSDPDSSSFDPVMTAQAFFAGQIAFSPNFLVRTELSVQTADILKAGLFKDTDATFCIDELSLTYRHQLLNTSQYFSLFLGTYEPIGSDLFLQRQFGIKPISSHITESWLGLHGSVVYPFYGAGGSYVIHFDKAPIASGIYIYENHENDNDDAEMNVDFRIASVMQYFTVDFAAGLGAPLETKNGDANVILLINTLYLHTGINMLIGNSYTSSLFLQGGFANLPVRAEDTSTKLDSSDIYLIAEPRLVTRQFQAHLTMFSFPQETADKLVFIDDTFGFNLALFTDNLYVRNTNVTFGFNTTLSFPGKNFLDLSDKLALFDNDGYNVRVSPYVALPVMTGTLHLMLQATITDFIRGESWPSALEFNIGYKAQL